MNTRKILKQLSVIAAVSAACALIGLVEGLISGSVGFWVLAAFGCNGYTMSQVTEAAVAASAGVTSLAVVEGAGLGALAVRGFFGTAEDMEKTGYKNFGKRVLGYFGYTANQVLGGMIAGLLLMLLGARMSFSEIVPAVAVGAGITGIAITPVVTFLAVWILAAAYAMTKDDAPAPVAYNRI